MFNQPFETTPCAGHQTKEIQSGLLKAQAMGELVAAKTVKGRSVPGVVTVPSYVKTIPPFFHPIILEGSSGRQIAIDSRSSLKASPDGEARITSPADYGFLLNRAILMQEWVEQGSGELLRMADFPATVYMRWISEAVSRRLALDPAGQMTVTVLAGHFFFSSFGQQIERMSLAQRIARLTRIPFQTCHDIITALSDQDQTTTNAGQFVDWVREQVPSPRTLNFNLGLLYAAVGSAWYGSAAREISAVAVEYPPYLFSMIYSGLQDRSFRNTPMNRLVMDLDRRGAGKQYLMQMASLIEVLSND